MLKIKVVSLLFCHTTFVLLITVVLSRNLGTLTSWKPLGHSRPVTGLLCLTAYNQILLSV